MATREEILAEIKRRGLAAPKPAEVTKAEAIGTGAAQGATFGFGEELGAPVQKGIAAVERGVGRAAEAVGGALGLRGVEEFGERARARGEVTGAIPSERLVEEAREDIAGVRQARPILTGVGQVAGAAVPASLLASIPAVAGALQSAPILAGAALGAGTGALAAVGESVEKSFKDAAIGGTIGGVLGGAGGAIAKSPKALEKAATTLGRKAIGAIKSVVNKMGGPEKVDDTVNVLLANNVIKGSLDDIGRNVTALRDQSGEFIGATLQQLDDAGFKNVINPQKLADAVSKTKVPGTDMVIDDIMRLPIGRGLQRQYQDILETAADPAFSQGTFKSAQNLKNVLRDSVNFAKDNAERNLFMKAYFAVRDSIDDAVTQAAPKIGDPKLASKFADAKKAYGAAKQAEIAIDDSLRRATGNKIFGLTDWIAVTSRDPLTGAATTVGKKVLEAPRTLGAGARAARGAATLLDTVGAGRVGQATQAAVPGLAGVATRER